MRRQKTVPNPPPLPDTPLSLTHDTQACFKNTEPHQSGGVKEKKDKGASCSTDNIIPHSLRSPIAMWSLIPFSNAESGDNRRDRHSRFLQAQSRQYRFGRGWGKWTQVGEGPACRSVHRSQPPWARLLTLERPDRNR